MPTLAPPPPRPAPPPLRTQETDPSNIPFTGRSLAEYVQCFALDLTALRGRDVLDVAAGASSFTAEACARKIDAVAVDPHYSRGLPALVSQVGRDTARMSAELRGSRQLRRNGLHASIEAIESDRRAAAQRFLADYEAHALHGRYVPGSLPLLPFFDATFDLVLCSHLLFHYDGAFDFDWHLAACRELVRVSAGEVRVFPIGGPDGKPFPGLTRLRRELREFGITSTVRAVGCDGASMLVLGV